MSTTLRKVFCGMHATHRQALRRQCQKSCSSAALKATCMRRNTLRIASNDADCSAPTTSTRIASMRILHMTSRRKIAGNKQQKKFASHAAFSRRTNLFARTLRKLFALLATKSSGVSLHAHSTHAALRSSACKVRPRKNPRRCRCGSVWFDAAVTGQCSSLSSSSA